MSRRIIVPCLLVFIAVSYANILGNSFTNWDDEHLIVKNRAIRSLEPLFVLKHFHLTYPPLTVFSHGLDYFFWRLNPVGYHLSDLLLYSCVVVAFFFLCERIAGSTVAAFIAAAAFAVHPLHVESVTWLSSRKDGLGLFFYLLAFLAYLRAGREDGRGFLALSVFFYLCAIWSKPLMVTLPLALVAYDLLLAPVRSRLRSVLTGKLPYLVPLALTAAAAALLDPRNETGLSYHGGSAYRSFLMMLTVLTDYVRMMLLPLNLSCLYVVSIPGGIGEIPCLFSASILLALLIAAAAAVRRLPLFSFCVFWAFLSLLPVMQIIPVNVVKADRYLYLPTAALCLLAGGAAAFAYARSKRRGVLLASAALVTGFAILTISRNSVWRNSVSLWMAVVKRNPKNSDAYNNLGIAFTRKGRAGEAEAVLKLALMLRPDFPSAHNNLANVYRLTGRYDEALVELQKAMGLTSDVVYAANVYINMGMVYEARGEYSRALEAYETAMTLSPSYLDDSLVTERMERCRRKRGDTHD